MKILNLLLARTSFASLGITYSWFIFLPILKKKEIKSEIMQREGDD